MRPGRRPFASGDWFDGNAEEYREEASTYIAYSRPFHVDEEKKTLTHSMFVSLFPNGTGQTQPRVVEIEEDRLRLSTESAIRSAGKVVMSYLEWQRAGKEEWSPVESTTSRGIVTTTSGNHGEHEA
jgi:hypothetical protein